MDREHVVQSRRLFAGGYHLSQPGCLFNLATGFGVEQEAARGGECIDSSVEGGREANTAAAEADGRSKKQVQLRDRKTTLAIHDPDMAAIFNAVIQ